MQYDVRGVPTKQRYFSNVGHPAKGPRHKTTQSNSDKPGNKEASFYSKIIQGTSSQKVTSEDISGSAKISSTSSSQSPIAAKKQRKGKQWSGQSNPGKQSNSSSKNDFEKVFIPLLHNKPAGENEEAPGEQRRGKPKVTVVNTKLVYTLDQTVIACEPN